MAFHFRLSRQDSNLRLKALTAPRNAAILQDSIGTPGRNCTDASCLEDKRLVYSTTGAKVGNQGVEPRLRRCKLLVRSITLVARARSAILELHQARAMYKIAGSLIALWP